MGASRTELEELLQPSLQEEDDPRRMNAAWNPWNVAIFAILGGPLPAGILFGENSRRLGRDLQFPLVLAGVLLTLLAGYVAGRVGPEFTQDAEGARTTMRLVTRLVTVGLTLPLCLLQMRRFRTFTGSGKDPGKLLLFGLVTMLVAGFLGNLLAYGVMRWTS